MDVSVLIAARNEEWLGRTVAGLLENMRGDTEVIVVADGGWPPEALDDHPRVTLLCRHESIGQRAAVNQAARLARGRFLMKLDAHCVVDEGFDVKLVEPYDSGELAPDATTVPRMFNLHVFDWVCACGQVTYQGPAPEQCEKCGTTGTPERVVRWKPRLNRRSDFARFDHTLHFRYWGSCERRPESRGEIADLMSFIGACWFMPRDRFAALGGCDEGHGSWGQFGAEIACKSWLSGGRLVVNKRTWFSHLFRTQEGFGFPYPLPGSQVDKARAYSRQLWTENAWPGQRRPLAWLVEKFAPVPGWHEPADEESKEKNPEARRGMREAREATLRAVQERGPSFGKPAPRVKPPSVGVVYYTDNRPKIEILVACRRQLLAATNGHKIVSVSINGHAPLADWPMIALPYERGHLTMFKQILAGLEALDTDVVFFAEHDVLYHPSHFEFKPPRVDCYYYNRNAWKVDWATGRTLFYLCDQTSQLCASRALLLEHYRKRVARVEAEGFTRRMGFEPGTRKVRHGGVDDVDAVTWMSAQPNIDVRHDKNLTGTRWRRDQFRNQKFCQGWQESEVVPGWGRTAGGLAALLRERGM